MTGLPAGYGFVEFSSHEIASHILNTFNGMNIPGTFKVYRLNWGMFGGGSKPGVAPQAAPPQPAVNTFNPPPIISMGMTHSIVPNNNSSSSSSLNYKSPSIPIMGSVSSGASS